MNDNEEMKRLCISVYICAMSQSHSKTNVVPEGTNINPDLDSEKRNCKSQDLAPDWAIAFIAFQLYEYIVIG
jgi:hypothetical protein